MTKLDTKTRKNNISVVCEGETEYNYLNGLKKRTSAILNIKPVDAHGGGYKKILNEIKKISPIGVVARFALIDFDRYISVNKEDEYFEQLLSYCRNECKKNNPTFLVVSNPDFDYFVLKHDKKYRGQDKKIYINNNYVMTLDEFKVDQNIFEKFNKNSDELARLMTINNSMKCIVSNEYSFSKDKFTFSKMKIKFNKDNMIYKEVNFIDLYQLLFDEGKK